MTPQVEYAKKDLVQLQVCKRTNEQYQKIRDRHYVANNGCHGQQIHFLVYYDKKVVGIISGASSVYAVKDRDDFFKIPKDKNKKQKIYLPAIINNVVFRIEKHDLKNLATITLAKFRKTITKLWENLYGVPVIGFETFVVEEDYRKGSLYKADNWTCVGETKGSTKTHKGLKSKSERKETSKKLIFCLKNSTKIPTKEYVSSWRAETAEEKRRAKEINALKKEMLDKFY